MKPINIPSSKSLSNRYLILKYLYSDLKLENLSTAKDTQILQKALQTLKQDKNVYEINIGHAGTAMRFLTALLSIQTGKKFILDGSSRMRQRPISVLVDALRQLGADITYLEKEGYPPLLIQGKDFTDNEVSITQNISSQYISALLLIAPALPKGLSIHLKGQQVSKPYVQMTLQILSRLGVQNNQNKNKINVFPTPKLTSTTIKIEGDWSSASYFYGAAAVLKQTLLLQNFKHVSLQGDRFIHQYFEKFGIKTDFISNKQILLTPRPDFKKPDFLKFDLIDTPDLAQTLAVTCLALGIKCKLTGLQTLKIKETDRLLALKNEMIKLGAKVKINDSELEILNPVITHTDTIIKTYDDHRMAMSFAILQILYPAITIEHPDVVVKSFPDFWEKFKF